VHEFALPHGMLAIWITVDCRRVGANVPLGRFDPFAKLAAICAFQPKIGFDELRNFSLSNVSKSLGSGHL
jgi:hypothetical protein